MLSCFVTVENEADIKAGYKSVEIQRKQLKQSQEAERAERDKQDGLERLPVKDPACKPLLQTYLAALKYYKHNQVSSFWSCLDRARPIPPWILLFRNACLANMRSWRFA